MAHSKSDLKQLTDDQLQARLDELTAGMKTVMKDYSRRTQDLYKESDKNLAAMEAADLDAELEPVESQAVADMEVQLAEFVGDVERAGKEQDDLDAQDAADDAADKDLPEAA